MKTTLIRPQRPRHRLQANALVPHMARSKSGEGEVAAQSLDGRIRVLHCLPYCIIGGAEAWLRTLTKYSPDIDHHLLTFYHTEAGLALFADAGVQILSSGWTDNSDAARKCEPLRNHLAAHPDYDVIHLSHDRGMYDVASRFETPIVVTTHAPYVQDWTVLMRERDVLAYTSKAQQLLHKKLALRCREVLCVNGIDPAAVIGNGAWLRNRLEIPEDAFLLAWVGRASDEKNAMSAVRLANGMAGSDIVVLFCLAACVPYQERDAGRITALLRGNPNARVIHNRLPGNIGDVYAACDALLMTSHAESFGLVCAEAQAAGKPVLGYDQAGTGKVAGINEIVIDGKTGLLVPLKDEGALAAAARGLAEDRPQALAMGAAGRERAARLFDGRRMAQDYQRIYESLVMRPTRRKAPVCHVHNGRKPGIIIYSWQQFGMFGGGPTTSQIARSFRDVGWDVIFLNWTGLDDGVLETGAEHGIQELSTKDFSVEDLRRFLYSHERALWWCGLPSRPAIAHWEEVWRSFPQVATIYHIRDWWPNFAVSEWNDRHNEIALAGSVDVVSGIAPQYAGYFPENPNINVSIIPNGADPDLFTYKPRKHVPAIGTAIYWGSYCSDFWDDKLFREVARRLPKWTFRLIGGYERHWNPQGLPPNVERLGWQRLERLDDFAQKADIGIIPFLDNPIARHCDPIKAWEYAACGLPMIGSGPMALATNGCPNAVSIAPNADEWVRTLSDIHERDFIEVGEDFIWERCSWQARRDKFIALAEQAIGVKLT